MTKRTQRQIQASKVALLPEGFENLPSEIAVLQEQMKSMNEVKADVKVILASVEDIKLAMVSRPTFEQAAELRKPLEARLSSLEEIKAEAKGGYWALAKATGFVLGLVTVGYYINTLFHFVK
jgi:hypothetical protein